MKIHHLFICLFYKHLKRNCEPISQSDILLREIWDLDLCSFQLALSSNDVKKVKCAIKRIRDTQSRVDDYLVSNSFVYYQVEISN